MAEPDGARSLLRKRPAAELGRLVRPATPARVSRGHHIRDARHGARRRLAARPAPAIPPCLLSLGHAVPGGHHPDREPRVYQPPVALARRPAARRSILEVGRWSGLGSNSDARPRRAALGAGGRGNARAFGYG